MFSQNGMNRCMKGRLVQLNFSAEFDRVSHRGLLYKLKSIGVRRQFLSIVSEFHCDRRQRVRLDVKVCESFDVVSEMLQGSVLEPLLFMLYTSDLFRVVGSHIVGYADDTTIYVVIPRPLIFSSSTSPRVRSP